ncbi:hypothetical protein ABTE45_19175, partial [Acinetobacter baumannii]
LENRIRHIGQWQQRALLSLKSHGNGNFSIAWACSLSGFGNAPCKSLLIQIIQGFKSACGKK